MQSYVETLLLDQLRKAERFSAQQGIELRQYSIFAALPQAGSSQQENAAVQNAAAEAGAEAAAAPPGQTEQTGAAAVLQRLEALQTAGVRARSAGETARQAAMARSAAADGMHAGGRRGFAPEQTEAGSFSQTLLSSGVASRPTERSMREISRFFERDSRRYG